MKVFPMLFVLAAVACVSCERHEWAETKKLSEEHSHGAHAGHGDAAHEEGHAETGHGEKSEKTEKAEH